MSYFLFDAEGRAVGPYSREELFLFRDRGLIRDDASVTATGWTGPRPLKEILDRVESGRLGTAEGRPPRSEAGDGSSERGTSSAGEDFIRLAPHLMLPMEDFGRLRRGDARRILAMALAGLAPLFLLIYLQKTTDLGGAMWGVALYSSVLWAFFFYTIFSPPEVTVWRCVLAYAGSAVFSIGLVSLARVVIPLEWVAVWITSPDLGTRWAGHLVGVAWIEELAKLFMLYFLWPRRPQPQVVMFYGLMAGLGFGIYEGVMYQSSQNLRISFPPGRPTAEGAALYYMLNILRLTSLPFLHATWTGIAGYFLGFAGLYPNRRGGLLLAAVVVPSLLHATYNAFSNSMLGLTMAVLTVVALNLYLVKGRDFEALLAGRERASNR